VRLQNIFFRFDPLIFIITSIAYRAVITASSLSLIVIIGTFLFGRFFCGFICPLGTVIDISDSILCHSHPITASVAPAPSVYKHTGKQSHIIKIPSFKNGKYLILIFLLMSAFIGSAFIHFFDPLVIFERSLTLLLYPVLSYFIGLFTRIPKAVFTETFIALIFFITILGLSLITPRFWCRNLCPLGGLLAFLSKFSIFKFTLSETCKQCGICDDICPTGAISSKDGKLDAAECILCLRCQYECSNNAIVYKRNFSSARFDIKRREFVTSIAASLITVPLSRSFLHRRLAGRLLRPPGSIPESDFLNVCLHCGMCMKVCPTNGLQPCILEAGISGLWTPKLVPRIGGCEKNCNKCGQVCPTSAIRSLSLEEKTYAKIGTAVIDKNRCIAWEQDKVCLICDEVCPFNAISSLNETIQGTTLLRPFVDEEICTGCGLCEAPCPIEGLAAIQVFTIGEERKTKGSYITEDKKRLRACDEKHEDIPSGFILE